MPADDGLGRAGQSLGILGLLGCFSGGEQHGTCGICSGLTGGTLPLIPHHSAGCLQNALSFWISSLWEVLLCSWSLLCKEQRRREAFFAFTVSCTVIPGVLGEESSTSFNTIPLCQGVRLILTVILAWQAQTYA